MSEKTEQQNATKSQGNAAQAGGQEVKGEKGRSSSESSVDTNAGSEDVLQQVQAIATEYYEKLAEVTSGVSEQAKGYYGDGQQYVRSHPGGTVGGAFAFGVLLGVMFGRD